MAKLHWGSPANPGELRFHTGTLSSKSEPEGRKYYNRHEVTALYGFSGFGVFIGVIQLGKYGSEIGRQALSSNRRGE